MSADATAAERARRYRARRRERDVTERHGSDGARSRSSLAWPMRCTSSPSSSEEISTLLISVTRSHVTRARVTSQSVTAPMARASRTRVRARLRVPTGLEGAGAIPELPSRVTDPAIDPRARILEALESHGAHSVGAIADALGIGTADAAAELVALLGLGRVRRIPAEMPAIAIDGSS